MLLAQAVHSPARANLEAELSEASGAAWRQTHRTLAQAFPAHAAAGTNATDPAATLALCATCSASHQLVRVLRRRQQHGMRSLRTIILVDQSWPALDSLVRDMTGSRLVVDASLGTRVAVTPAALVADAGGAVPPLPSALVIGTPAVATRLTPTASPP
jgi:hypothetical protein